MKLLWPFETFATPVVGYPSAKPWNKLELKGKKRKGKKKKEFFLKKKSLPDITAPESSNGLCWLIINYLIAKKKCLKCRMARHGL